MRFIPAVSIGILLLFTYHLYGYAYLSTDDFINLYWVQMQSARDMAWHVLNPASAYFRPTGTVFYWLLLHFFDLNAAMFHFVAWSIHAANTALVYLILKRVSQSRSGAAIGAMLFASQAAFADIYWNFGSIFDLVGGFAFFAGILLWTGNERSWRKVFLCTLIFLFAIKAKEMAITLPAIWLTCDIFLRRNVSLRKVAQFLAPGCVGIWYGLAKLGELRQVARTDLYYMDIRWITLGRSFASYFNSIFDSNVRWQLWSIGFVALLLFFASRKNYPALFFQLYFFITLLPVIFLINHRELYLAYIPFLGLCGLAALLVAAAAKMAESRVEPRTLSIATCALFPLLCWGTYAAQRNGSEERRIWQKPMSIDYRAFVTGMRSLQPPPPGETLYFDSHPLYLSRDLLLNATQVALRRTDIDVQLVSEFPPDARYKIRYERSRVIRLP